MGVIASLKAKAKQVQDALDKTDPATEAMVRNYLTLRKAIGWLGIALPLVVWAGVRWLRQPQQPTISDYYYTGMGDVFVGILWAIGIFLFCYKGPRLWDNYLSNMAGTFAILVAVLPTTPKGSQPIECTTAGIRMIQPTVGTMHIICAGLFFAVITYMALVRFQNPGHKWPNRTYRLCGSVMALAILWMLISRHVSFAAEAVAVEAFGIAWLVNGVERWKTPQITSQPSQVAGYKEF